MAERAEQQSTTSLPWWVRTCRVGWKAVRYFWAIFVLTLVLPKAVDVLFSDKPLRSLPNLWPILEAIVHHPIWTALTFLGLLLLTGLFWFGSRERATTKQGTLSEQNRTHMLRRLRLRYEQMITQSLQGAVQMELGLASRPAAVQNAVGLSMRLPDQPELALHLTQQAEQDATQPLPILLPLSTWAVSRRPLHDWLSEQFTLLYDVPRSLSQQWIQEQQLLPLLDGFDEMEAAARAEYIVAINTYHREHLQPLVVCSRTNEYEMAARRERLNLHSAIIVQYLSKEQIDAHLASIGKPVATLRTALRKNSTLHELATTPLMLQVLLLAYNGTSVRELSQKGMLPQQEIWDDYVQHMISRKGNAKRFPLPITIVWLKWLAQEMREHNQTIFSLEQLQSNWLPTRRRAFYRWSFVPVLGLVFGLVFGLVGGLFGGLVGGWAAALQHYILRFWLWRTHVFPWRVVPFLDDATARILLRRVGDGYSFTHRLLLEHFADLNTQTLPMSTARSST